MGAAPGMHAVEPRHADDLDARGVRHAGADLQVALDLVVDEDFPPGERPAALAIDALEERHPPRRLQVLLMHGDERNSEFLHGGRKLALRGVGVVAADY